MPLFSFCVNFAKNSDMTLSYILRANGVLTNALSVVDATTSASTFRVRLTRTDRNGNVIVLGEESAVSKPYSLTFALPLDADDNPLRITYSIREQEESWGSTETEEEFDYSFIPFIPEIGFTADGFSSVLEVSDDSDYTNYDFVDRLITVTPPSTSPLSEETASAATLSYEPNIYSGSWEVSLKVKVIDNSDGYLVEDEPIVTETHTVRPQLTEEEMFEGVKDYFDTYQTYLETAPKKALAMQPNAVLLGSWLHQYFIDWRRGDKEQAYQAMLHIYDILELDDEVVVEEITPFDITEVDHEHSNLTILDFFTEADGNLYWNGGLIGEVTETGKVRTFTGDSLDFLEDKIDSSMQVTGNTIGVDPNYIGSFADDVTITYDSGTKKFSASVEGEAIVKLNLVRKWEVGTFAAGEMVYRTDTGVDTFYVASVSTTNQPPHADWRLATDSDLRHIVNQDIKLGNHVIEVNTSDITDDALDIEWETCNSIRIVQDDTTDSMKYLVGTVSELQDDLDLPIQDITIIYEKDDANFTIESLQTAASRIGFNNLGIPIVLSATGDWVRYRYSKDKNRFELIATNLTGTEYEGLTYDDFSAANTSSAGNPLTYSEGVYTLNPRLDKYDNSISLFVNEGDVGDLVVAALALVSHNDLDGIDGTGTIHVDQTQIDTWDAKQDAITGAATTIDDTDLTADRVLVSSGTGKVAVSDVTVTQLNALFEASSLRAYPIRLNASAEVDDRIAGLVEGVDYPTGWVLSDDDAALIITHNLDRPCFDVKVKSKIVGGNLVQLKGDVAYSTLTDELDGTEFNSIRLDALATVNTELYLYVII